MFYVLRAVLINHTWCITVHHLQRELEEAQRIATQKKPLEQQLRKQIAELEDNNQDLMVTL